MHESGFCQSNAVVVQGAAGVLVIDAGVFEGELLCLANDLLELGQVVVAGFSTHPHWDHLLWHSALGTATRFGTDGCAATAEDRLSGGVQAVAQSAGIPEHVPLELLGHVTGLPANAVQIPWDGPRVRIIEHRAHAPGHAALVMRSSLFRATDRSVGSSRFGHGSIGTGSTFALCATAKRLSTHGSGRRLSPDGNG